jgi:HPt (histidine-containing phosphotransfer) domain-containing protein
VRKLTDAQRAELQALTDAYRAELPRKMELISGAAAQLQAEGWGKPELQSLYELIHRLAGSAAIYGFDGIGRAAADLEEWALSAIDEGLPEARRGELAILLAALDEAFTASRTVAAGGSGRRGSSP